MNLPHQGPNIKKQDVFNIAFLFHHIFFITEVPAEIFCSQHKQSLQCSPCQTTSRLVRWRFWKYPFPRGHPLHSVGHPIDRCRCPGNKLSRDSHVGSDHRSNWYPVNGAKRLYGPPIRYAILRVAHALGMPGTFSPPPRVSDPDMHHGQCVTHMPWRMLGSLISGFLWSRWWGKRSRCMRNPQFYVSGKKQIAWCLQDMGRLSVSMAHCEDNRPVTRGFPSERASDADLWWFLRC